jgi:hypothetical protein
MIEAVRWRFFRKNWARTTRSRQVLRWSGEKPPALLYEYGSPFFMILTVLPHNYSRRSPGQTWLPGMPHVKLHRVIIFVSTLVDDLRFLIARVNSSVPETAVPFLFYLAQVSEEKSIDMLSARWAAGLSISGITV